MRQVALRERSYGAVSTPHDPESPFATYGDNRMNIRHGIIAAALLAPLALCAAPAPSSTSAPSAQSVKSARSTMPKPPVPKFAQADTNHDGKVSWKEARALGVPEKLFKQDDFDKSGDLNETEWMFVRLDMTDFTPPGATSSAPASSH